MSIEKREVKRCVVCQKLFSTRANRQKICSQECRRKWSYKDHRIKKKDRPKTLRGLKGRKAKAITQEDIKKKKAEIAWLKEYGFNSFKDFERQMEKL